MNDIRQERPNESPILKLNKKLKKIWHTRQGIYGLLALEKINTVAFLVIKLLAENPRNG